MPRKAKTTEEFQNELNIKYPDKYTIIGEYKNAKTKLKIKYNKCGHENMVIPSNLLGGYGCPICNNENRVSHEEFLEKVKKKNLSNRYEFLSEYKNSVLPIKIRHKECGHIEELTSIQILKGVRCGVCYPSKLDEDIFMSRLREIYGDEYSLVSDYKTFKDNVVLKHNKCGNSFEVAPSTIFKEKHDLCPYCKTNNGGKLIVGLNDIHTARPDLEKYLYDLNDAFKYAYGSNKKIMWKCPDCGHEFERAISNVNMRGFSCELCGNKTSYGERFIMAMFDMLQVVYKPQFLPDWGNGRRYDFLLHYNERDYIIEVDGGFHYVDNNMSGMTANEVRDIDNIKDKLAIDNGYSIIRIDYNYEHNDKYTYIVKSVMDSELSKLFDLSKIDFGEVDKIANKSLTVEIAGLWNNLKEKSIYELNKQTGMSVETLRTLLYRASDIGLIDESKDDIIKLNRMHGYLMLNNKPHKVMCNETGEIFDSFSAADKKYHASLTNYFRFNGKASGHLEDGTRLTWTLIEY